MRILLLNGPNLGRLGQRQPEIYGRTTLAEVVGRAADHAVARGATLEAFQSNHEGALIDRLERLDYDGVVINPGALGHTSYALRDALEGVERPAVEVHISDVFAREPFRHVLLLETVVVGQVVGRGVEGYLEAIDLLLEHARVER
ncbi:MAG TPA: type II 3-dehydroquinate dehydratase [Candidatus Limnocylindrales bacterium]|nr:type II 3-dehydroquinate dehydratase [Candidatus Limnocylindrales bacterium]